MAGTAIEVVLPERGAMIATMTSSQLERTSGPLGARSPSRTPVSSGLISRGLALERLGRRSRALAVISAGSSGASSLRPARPFGLRRCLDHSSRPAAPSAIDSRAGATRVLISSRSGLSWGKIRSGCSAASTGWNGAHGMASVVAAVAALPPSQAKVPKTATMTAAPMSA